MPSPPAMPLRYAPAMERAEPDEAETVAGIVEAMHHIQEVTYRDGGHGLRSVHAKAHGLLRGELRVAAGLPPVLAQGLFARPGTYGAVLRFSTNAGDILDDSVALPRGLALKVIGVEGERLPGSEGAATQDFVLVNGPAFVAPTPQKFLGSLKLLAKTTDTPQVLKKAISAALRGAETVLEAFGGESAALKSLGGAPQAHPLGETYYSQTPFLYGSYVAKFSLAPVSAALAALTGQTVATRGRSDALREDIEAFFHTQGGTWEVRAQLCTDLETMPAEDASTPWPEETSPFVPVAELHLPAQPSWSPERVRTMDDGLAFNPWHGLAAHRPLGAVNRARRAAYLNSAEFRSARNGCPIQEPRRLDDVAA